MNGITSEGVWMWTAFGKASGFLRLPTAVCFIPYSCNLVSRLFAPESKFCLSHRRAPAPLNCLSDRLGIQR